MEPVASKIPDMLERCGGEVFFEVGFAHGVVVEDIECVRKGASGFLDVQNIDDGPFRAGVFKKEVKGLIFWNATGKNLGRALSLRTNARELLKKWGSAREAERECCRHD